MHDPDQKLSLAYDLPQAYTGMVGSTESCPQCGFSNPLGFHFCGQCGTVLNAAHAVHPPSLKRQQALERRQLTVMFCDLVGSTSLSEKLDPEDFGRIMFDYKTACTAVVHRFEGYIQSYLGDGMLIYFGYPQAHEDDARRAVLASLGIVRAMAGLNRRLFQDRDIKLEVRVGIHTGLVIIDSTVDAAVFAAGIAVGETPNIAARLQAMAQPDSVVIGDVTHQLIKDFFECRSLGECTLKGISRSLHLYQVCKESAARNRIHAALKAGLTPLTGREQEIEFLLTHWRTAMQGGSKIVLLSGEAGIGKSRLIETLKARVAAEPGARLVECLCSPYHRNRPFYPYSDWLERLIPLPADQSAAARVQRLKAFLQQSEFSLEETLPWLTRLLLLPPDSNYPFPAMTPERQRQQTMETLLQVLLKHSPAESVLLVVEDLHWADPSTLELLELLVARLPLPQVFIVLTYRPEFKPSWEGNPHIAELQLQHLDPVQVESLIKGMTGGKALPAPVLAQVVRKTAGVPLFVEELIRMLLESDLLTERTDSYELTDRPLPLDIPVSLQDLLMARLDRLGSVKTLAQLGALLGSEFPYELLLTVTNLEEKVLREDLSWLVNAGFLIHQDESPQEAYAFKHALLQDAAINSLSRVTRQHYHQQIAQVLEERFPSIAANQPERLGQHWSLARLYDKAVPYLMQAGDSARSAYANQEAITLYETAADHIIKLLQTGNDTPEQWSALASAIHENLGDVLALLRRHDRAVRSYRTSLYHLTDAELLSQARLYRKLGLVHQHDREAALRAFQVAQIFLEPEPEMPSSTWRREWLEIQLGKLWVYYWKGEVDSMVPLVTLIQPFIQEYGTARQRAELFNNLTLINLRRDRYLIDPPTLSYARAFAAAADETGDLSEMASAHFTLGCVLLFANLLDETQPVLHEALGMAQKSGNRTIAIRCLNYLGVLYRRRHETAPTRRYCTECVMAAAEMSEYVGTSRGNLAWLAWHDHDLDLTEQEGQAALAGWQKSPVVYPFQWTATLPLLAARLERRQLAEAMAMCRHLLGSEQQRLPAALMKALEDSNTWWEQNDHLAAQDCLQHGVQLAVKLGYL